MLGGYSARFWFVVVVVVLAVIDLESWVLAPCHQYSNEAYTQYSEKDDCAALHVIAFREISSLARNNEHELVAISTFAIALFTLTLWWATMGVQKATREAIKLAREEFVSTHRPKIIIHAVNLALDFEDESPEPTAGAQVFYFNIGATSARVTEIVARISRFSLPLQTGLWINEQLRTPRDKIEGGMGGFIRVTSTFSLDFERTIQASESNPRGAVFCLGRIVYFDDRGVRRETAFCRRLNAISERWMPTDEPEYEYAY